MALQGITLNEEDRTAHHVIPTTVTLERHICSEEDGSVVPRGYESGEEVM